MSFIEKESERWRAAAQRAEFSKPLGRLDRIWLNMVRLFSGLFVRKKNFLKRAEQVELLFREYVQLNDTELQSRLSKYRELFRLSRQSSADEMTALALIGAACSHAKGISPYRVQYAGVLAMQSNSLIEMATGEGKSLVAAMAGILRGWYGRGCHVLTVNDYLAERDAQEMRALYEYCGCSVSIITAEMKPAERQKAYQADVTYCSEREVVADYLRDTLVFTGSKTLVQKISAFGNGKNSRMSAKILQRGIVCAVIDEADSLLIDRAITPLIISKEVEGMISAQVYKECAGFIEVLEPGRDYKLDKQYKSISLLKEGFNCLKGKDVVGIRGRMLEDLVNQALQAKHFFKLDHDYIIDEGKVVLVDNATGRLMRDHSWKGGIQQAVEAKEGLEVTSPKETCCRISFQRFFRMYKLLSGMTGTASEAKTELWQEYRLHVIPIPTRKPSRRVYRFLNVCLTREKKWEAVLTEALKEHKKGRPVLVGTRHVRDSELLGELFRKNSVKCRVLNAVNHYEEAEIVKDAGQAGVITIATNMAGRGTDIKLGAGVGEMGGLHVIATEMHSNHRIDR